MQNISSNNLLKIFNFYRTSLFSISNDLNFLSTFLDNQIEVYNNNNPDRFIFESLFHVYDIPDDSQNGTLKIYKNSFKLLSTELPAYRKKSFSWIMNLSILKAYNSCELLLLNSIQLSYFPNFESPLNGRKKADKIHKEIKTLLSDSDTTNNRHLINFLKIKSQKFDNFSKQLVRINFKSNWTIFFELISILRNVIAHNSAVIDNDTLNQIRSISKDIYETYFDLSTDENGFNILNPKEGDSFPNFLYLINDFTLNTAKFIFEKEDLSFLDLK